MDYSITLRVARLVWLMARNGGQWMSTMEVARLLDMTPNGAWAMLNRLAVSPYVPIVAQRARRGEATLWRIERGDTPSGSGKAGGQ